MEIITREKIHHVPAEQHPSIEEIHLPGQESPQSLSRWPPCSPSSGGQTLQRVKLQVWHLTPVFLPFFCLLLLLLPLSVYSPLLLLLLLLPLPIPLLQDELVNGGQSGGLLDNDKLLADKGNVQAQVEEESGFKDEWSLPGWSGPAALTGRPGQPGPGSGPDAPERQGGDQGLQEGPRLLS